MLHLKIDLTGSTTERLVMALESMMEDIAQGSHQGPGYEVTGESEPEDEAGLDENWVEDDDLLEMNLDTLHAEGEDEPLRDVVCLSGSMRFFPQMLDLAAKLTREGKIVLPPFAVKDGDAGTDAALDALHRRKIALSETLYVVAVDGYIGESTRNEIAFAQAHGISVVFWQPESGESDPQ